jgi:cellulose synthase/poly-beta-1,6-N-acetylglucosamine synthase-like glycosyltransferase
MILIGFTILLFLFYASLILYYRSSWLSIPVYRTSTEQPSTSVTVIIPARDEALNIKICIESILKGTYPANLYEIIVVDDHSTDDTAAIVKSYSLQNVRLITLKDEIKGEELNSYKKKAIEIAIRKATGDLIVTTDADCILPTDWLSVIAGYYEKYHPAFIAAPVSYYGENSFLRVFQSLDFMTLQGITGAALYKRFHNMCNGANLAYEKKAFYEVNGFTDIDKLASGDDMMLMHKIHSRYPDRVMYLKSEDAIVRTKPMDTWGQFFNQRIRWSSKSDKYADNKIIGVLMLVYLFNVCLLILAIAAFFFPSLWIWLLSILAGKILVELLFLFPVASFFGKRKLLWWFIPSQPFHILYIIIAGWLGKFGSYKWKGRKVK